MAVSHGPEPFGAGTLVTSFGVKAVLGTNPKLLTFVDVCRQNKTKWATSAPTHSLETLLLFKAIFTSNKDEKGADEHKR